MSTHLCITVRWIGDRFHGFIDGTETLEWPPSPFRLLQALIAGAHRYGLNAAKSDALAWIERQLAPDVLASPQPSTGTLFDHWVPDNDNLLNHRRGSIRKFCPILLEASPLVHYVWQIDPSDQPSLAALEDLASTLSSLGWAIDQAYAVVTLTSGQQIDTTILERDRLSRFQPAGKTTSTNGSLRVPKPGSIRDLEWVHAANCTASKNQAERRRKKWPKVFDRILYSSGQRPIGRPYCVFELRQDDGSFCRYSQRKLIHIAGMVRHLAKEAMMLSPPVGVDHSWVERYVAGHARKNRQEHHQFSYLPLPSIGYPYADQAVRRVMIAASVGDDEWLEHLARRLQGQRLKPEWGNEFGEQGPPILVRVRRDNVALFYTSAANRWASVTPVILPGHDDRKPAKTRRLIEAALAQSDIEQPCTFEWSPFSRFRNSLSAHKYGSDRKPSGYIRPDYLLSQTAVHLTLAFKDNLKVPGPLAIGAGRHCGLGLFAAVE